MANTPSRNSSRSKTPIRGAARATSFCSQADAWARFKEVFETQLLPMRAVNPLYSVVAMGAPGSGKSHMARAWAEIAQAPLWSGEGRALDLFDAAGRRIVIDDADRILLQRALELAERGARTAAPNPRVGCVIARNGTVVAEGWHIAPGLAHAEAMAELTSRERNARKEAEERGRTITALSARVAELEEALEGAEARRRANQNDRDRALDEKQRELDAMLERIAELESELEQATASANEARAAAAQAAASEPAASPRQVQALEFQLEELRKALSEARRATDARDSAGCRERAGNRGRLQAAGAAER